MTQTEGIIEGTLDQIGKAIREFLDAPENRCAECAKQPNLTPTAIWTRRNETTGILVWYVQSYDADWSSWAEVIPHLGERKRYCPKCREKKGI